MLPNIGMIEFSELMLIKMTIEDVSSFDYKKRIKLRHLFL